MKFRVIIALILCSLGAYVQGMENEQRQPEKQLWPLRKKWWLRAVAFNGTPPSLSSLVLIELARNENDKYLQKLPKELQEQVALLKEGEDYIGQWWLPEKPTEFRRDALFYPIVIEALIALSDKREKNYWLRVASEELALPSLEMFCTKGINWSEACEGSVFALRPLHVLVAQSIRMHNVDKIVQAIDLVFKSGADINCKDDFGSTTLHYAAGEHIPGVLELVVEFVKPKELTLPIVRYLVEHGADVNLPDDDGGTPLHEAVCSLNRTGIRGAEIIKYLLASGARADIKITKGTLKDCTPPDIAQRLLANASELNPETQEAILSVIQLLEGQKGTKEKSII
jgi:hypothetical protein